MTHIVGCSRIVDKVHCRNLADRYVCGQWVCPIHDPDGDASSCSHSLSSAGRCSYCGARV